MYSYFEWITEYVIDCGVKVKLLADFVVGVAIARVVGVILSVPVDKAFITIRPTEKSGWFAITLRGNIDIYP